MQAIAIELYKAKQTLNEFLVLNYPKLKMVIIGTNQNWLALLLSTLSAEVFSFVQLCHVM